MPLIESISLTNQAINTALSVPFSASPANYDTCYVRIWFYDLATVSSAKSANIYITRAGSGVESRSSISLTLTNGAASLVLQSIPFVLATGDIARLSIAGGAGDTANVDVIAELWGIPDLSAQITAVVNTLPTAAEIDAQLSGTHGSGTWGNGSGSTSTTVTVNDGVNPIDGVDVWVSTDSAGTNVIARGSTGALGTVVFMLDAGTYYAWKQLAGYDFTNPQSFMVS